MKNKLLPTVTLGLICLTVVLALALVNMLTVDKIAENQAQKIQTALSEVLPTGENFTSVEIGGLPESVVSAYTEDNGGYVFQLEVIGYKQGLSLMCGISPDGTVSGVSVIGSNETNGAETKLTDQKTYFGSSKETLPQEPEIISSSTKTSKAYHKAVSDALESYKIITEKEDTNEKQ